MMLYTLDTPQSDLPQQFQYEGKLCKWYDEYWHVLESGTGKTLKVLTCIDVIKYLNKTI